MPAIQHTGYFQTEHETIAYSHFVPRQNTIGQVLSLHGGGVPGRNRIYYIANHLARHQLSTFCFDFSGHGDSSGHIKKSSLKKRLHETLHAYQTFEPDLPLTVIGTSMGGYVALELLRHVSVINLVLFCPALYAKEAFPLRFDSGFTEVIRQQGSYFNAQALDYLREFDGRLLLIECENDEVIPRDVLDLYWQESKQTRHKRRVTLPQCPHWVHKWAVQNQGIQQQIQRELVDFLLPEYVV